MTQKMMMLQDGQFVKRGLRNPKEATFVGQIPSDFFRSCSQFLPPLQDLKLEFKLQRPEFVLTGTGNFKYELTSFEFFTR